MSNSDPISNAEAYLKLEADHMLKLLTHYEELSFALYKFYLVVIVAIVSVAVTISEKLGPDASFLGIHAIRTLVISGIVIGFFALWRFVSLQVRMTRALREANAIRGYFASHYAPVAHTVLYPVNPEQPSFLRVRYPFQIGTALLINAFGVAILLPMHLGVLGGIILIFLQLLYILFVLTRYQRRSLRFIHDRADIIHGEKMEEVKDAEG